MSKTLTLTASDGHTFSAYVAEPAGTPKGLVIVVQEIFGVNSHIRSVADGYAQDGYLAIAPALFDRVQKGYETGYTQPDIAAGVEVMKQASMDKAMLDLAAVMEYGKSAGKAAIVGYCWGGSVSWVAAARLPGLACSAPYYGGAIPTYINEKPVCPVMFHFGDADQSIPNDKAKAVADAHPSAITHFYSAGHGFNCDQRGSYHAESAALARSRTLEFFARHLG